MRTTVVELHFEVFFQCLISFCLRKYQVDKLTFLAVVAQQSGIPSGNNLVDEAHAALKSCFVLLAMESEGIVLCHRYTFSFGFPKVYSGQAFKGTVLHGLQQLHSTRWESTHIVPVLRP